MMAEVFTNLNIIRYISYCHVTPRVMSCCIVYHLMSDLWLWGNLILAVRHLPLSISRLRVFTLMSCTGSVLSEVIMSMVSMVSMVTVVIMVNMITMVIMVRR